MPSSFRPGEQESLNLSTAARYNAETQKRIVALALQLQQQHQETVSAAELEAVAVEVGLEPTFIQQAIAQTAENSRAEAVTGKPLWTAMRFGYGLSSNRAGWSKKDSIAFGSALVLAVLSGVVLAVISGVGL